MDAKGILKAILDDKMISVRKLAQLLGTQVANLYNIRYGRVKTFPKELVKSIKKVYPDYSERFLVGLSDDMYEQEGTIEDDYEEFNLKEFRKLNNLTQKDLAQIFSTQQSVISNIELGHLPMPKEYTNIIKQDAKYKLPQNKLKNEVTGIVEKNNYVEALELLLEHKNKEIENLNKLINQLKDTIKHN